jgi:hypothetical protein
MANRDDVVDEDMDVLLLLLFAVGSGFDSVTTFEFV